jgi:hypothetical protein
VSNETSNYSILITNDETDLFTNINKTITFLSIGINKLLMAEITTFSEFELNSKIIFPKY